MDKVIFVVVEKYFEGVLKLISGWWGVKMVFVGLKGVIFIKYMCGEKFNWNYDILMFV